MELAPFFRYLFPIGIIFMIGLLGRTRRVGFWWAFVLSIVLTPIGGFIVTVASGPKPIQPRNTRGKTQAKTANTSNGVTSKA